MLQTGDNRPLARSTQRPSGFCLLLATVALAVAAAVGGAGGVAARVAPSPCGARAATRPVVTHVIWIWFENHASHEILGSPAAPRINAAARACGLATNYAGVSHPSLPNYLAATSGSTHGIADDGPPAAHPIRSISIFEQARSAGSYEESMPGRCRSTDAYPYAPKHNPEVYYLGARARCAAGDVPLGTTSRGAFSTALAKGTLPAFSFVTPNLCNDMHDCPVSVGDAWLGRWLDRITASPTYRAGHTVVFVVWDEDDGSAANRVPLIVVSPWTHPGTRSAARFDHDSLLRTTEELLGIRAYLGQAASAPSLSPAFGL